MYALKTSLIAAGLALCLAAGQPSKSQAQFADNWYATVGIANHTNQTISYQFRWGENSQWETYWLSPYSSRVHYYTYSVPNQNHSPVPHIRFDIGGGVQTKEYTLVAYASPDTSYYRSSHYGFQYVGAYLELYKE